MLRELMESGDIAEIPVHIDSPMAVEVTEIYHKYAGTKDLDPALTEAEWQRVFPRDVQFHRTVEESKQLNRLSGPRVIIAASGMLTGGRVLHHLERLAPDEKNLIVLAGFHGADIQVRAEVISLLGLSAHADANELVRWVRSGDGATSETTFIVHGEPDAAAALSQRFQTELRMRTLTPKLGEVFDLSNVLQR
jgi:metallo-beta-lactamase family protein